MRLATYASISVAGTLIAVKLGAWLATESVSLLSTLLDSLLDAGASLINLLAVRRALEPADKAHRFGHGKAEPLSGLAQSGFICGSAAILVIQAGDRFLHPRPIQNTDIGYVVMVFAIVLTIGLLIFQKYVVRKTGSIAISSDSLHYQTDVLINLSVILSLFLTSEMGWTSADPLFAIAIAVYIVFSARKIWRRALNLLMDRELPEEDRRRIEEIALSHPGVRGMHDLRTRSSGARAFIQLHLELNGSISLNEAHEIAEAVMYKLEAAFPNAEVIIHEDPEGVMEKRAVFH
ncbi:MAG TPA: cation diffusion facilitator family transporter [Rhodospirillales bacterium]|nr:cation diffusion facilitator family transporter [Rhodospirillales bacterium]